MKPSATGLVAPRGDHRRLSWRIALIGDRATIDFAAHACAVQPPLNSLARVITAATAEAAVDDWERADKDREDALLVWPPEQGLSWNALIRVAAEEDPKGVIQIGCALVRFRDKGTSRTRDDLVAAVEPIPAIPIGAAMIEDHPSQRTIVIGVPTLGTVSTAWVAALWALQSPVPSWVYLAPIVGYEVGDARDRIVKAVLSAEPRPRWLCFLGDDNLPPTTGLKRLLDVAESFDRPAVSGLYAMRQSPPVQLVAWRATKDGLLRAGRDFQPGELCEVKGCGLDFCLLRTDWLEKVPVPRFVTRQAREAGMRWPVAHNEDAYFWTRAYEATGVRCLVDTGVRVGHHDLRTGQTFWPDAQGAIL